MKIIELPREGMQSSPYTIPTKDKIGYLNLLLRAGFDTVEVGSMASPKFVPQVADTVEVIRNIDLSGNRSKVMVLVLNKKGAETIAEMEEVDCISYPYSISPVFLKKNLNTTPGESFEVVRTIIELCRKNRKEPVIYFSMAFGNPYDDQWSMDLLMEHTGNLVEAGARIIPLSNVSVLVEDSLLRNVFKIVQKEFEHVEFGLHLHTDGKNQGAMIDAAYDTGIRRFDSVISGIGGCPMTGGKMLGNLDTGYLLHHCEKRRIETGIDQEIVNQAGILTTRLFRQ